MDPAGIFRIITNSTLLATRLLPAGRPSPLVFPSPRLCVTVAEDLPLGTVLSTVTAAYTHGEEVRYNISGGNTEGLFRIDQLSGTVTLAGALDHELCDKHELVVTAESGGRAALTVLVVRVEDVNDNPPTFLVPDQRLTIVEEDDRDLPAIIAKVEAVDADEGDAGRLVFRVSGDGAGTAAAGRRQLDVEDAVFFTINARTGDLIQLKALDRDPPLGRSVWRLRVEVRDGQRWGEGEATPAPPLPPISPTYLHRQASWGHHEPGRDPSVAEGIPSGEQKKKKINYHMKETSSLGLKTAAPRSGFLYKHNYDVRQERQFIKMKNVTGSLRLPRHFRSKFGVDFQCRDAECPREYGNGNSGSKHTQSTATETLYGRWNTAPRGLQMDRLKVLKKSRLVPIFTPEPHTTGQRMRNRRHHRREGRERALGRNDGVRKTSESVGHKSHRKVRKIRPRRPRTSINLPPRVVSRSTRGKAVTTGDSAITTHNTSWRITSSSSRESDTVQPYSRHRGVWSTLQPVNQAPNYWGRNEKGEVDFNLPSDTMCDSEPHGTSPGSDHPSILTRGRRVTRDTSGTTVRKLADAATDDLECRRFMLRRDSAQGGEEHWGRRVHVTETTVTVLVKDINDNAPVFPDLTMIGRVRENAAEGAAVVTVAAWDADDAADGTNARLTYAIEKNVVDEASGAALFSVEPHTGQVRTTRCCLDREATPEYRLQVVAADGGGLKGTGTVVVLVVDENDNPPRLARRRWELEVEETPPAAPPPNTTLLEMTAADKDTDTSFLFRVEPNSGPGWDNFGLRSVGFAGHLFARRSLDYEQEAHRRGFRFRVQVTDQAPGGWGNLAHMDFAWVTVRLKDVNDNPPLFTRSHAHVTVSEDAKPGTPLVSMPARDPDAGGHRGVDYRLQGGWDSFDVDAMGHISLRQRLDRESPRGAAGVALVVAVDRGTPPLTATATLTISVIDVNDCPPSILPPTVLHVMEGGPPTRLGVLEATDPDEWALGHGPPFNFSLASTNSATVLSLVKLKFDPLLFNGRGGAELWTAGSVDRERHQRLNVAVQVSDAQGHAATHAITVLVDDLNDNPMRPGAKTVYLWKTQGGGSDAPLGRVFVEDPDDWDLGDKEFHWAGSPHPLFSLHPRDGTIFASSQVREGRYELQFSVSDRVWRQRGVAANVTVVVHTLPPDALTHAAPLALTPTTPTDLTRGWSPSKGGGVLGALLREIIKIVGEPEGTAEVVSVYECGGSSPARQTAPSATPDPPSDPTTSCVWVSVKEADGGFVNSVKLQGLLTMHAGQLEVATRLSVAVTSDPGGAASPQWAHTLETPHGDLQAVGEPKLGAASFMASTSLPLQVVDTNTTSLVTPRLTRTRSCVTHSREPETCTPTSCLNGGRCVRNMRGENRCVCSGRAWGPQCKVLSRTFWGSGWAWLKPLPPCLPVTLAFRLLVRHPQGLLLYAGPLAPTPSPATPTPMLALQLEDGRPQALLEGEGGPIKLQVNTSLHDGRWHSLHLAVDHQGASLMVDQCGRGWEHGALGDAHCLARGRWRAPRRGGVWLEAAFLQVGGQAQTPPRPEDYGWREAPTRHRLTGCLSRLTVNTQVVDLGNPVHSHASAGGCREQDEACPSRCGFRGQCMGGLRRPRCECDPGWTGLSCATPTVPVRLGVASYVKVALAFSPEPWAVRAQVRVRLRGAHSGMLLQLAAHHRAATLTLQVSLVSPTPVSPTAFQTLFKKLLKIKHNHFCSILYFLYPIISAAGQN
ncbi:putative neural-cadherin 2 isoform X2 [Eriocheir sinensis]|uniref:putative neural-cadherin 2 isoform X2 n=1 Tax=Eriocheir sinensis TaxID=95602 RepID=UPI0021C704C2|nr:putative neural-cadherin 2 isoform X2 [Eriocheir sinensis]